MRSYEIRVGSKSNDWIFIKESKVRVRDKDTETGVEIGMKGLQAKDCWMPPEVRKRQGRVTS